MCITEHISEKVRVNENLFKRTTDSDTVSTYQVFSAVGDRQVARGFKSSLA